MKSLTILAVLSAIAVGAFAQAPTPTPAPTKERQPWEMEWAYLSKYRDADEKLGAPDPGEKRVVFLGDSITEHWGTIDPVFFGRTGFVGRGIGGQTTSQLLVRFRQDVIGIKPAVVVILGGTNDIAQNGGVTTLGAIEDNLHSMVDLARLNGMRVVLASVLPAIDYPWRKGLEPADKITALNRWIEAFCRANHLVYLDYYSAVVDDKRAMKPGLSSDGVHPTAAGYSVMEPLAEDAVRAALAEDR